MSSSNILHVSNYNFVTLLDQIKKGVFLIPSFQRGFTWKPKDITLLADSLIWQYPIASLLLTPPSSALQIAATALAGKEILTADNKHIDDHLYVLDGQQRLTALSLLFVKQPAEGTYYIDLLALISKGLHSGRLSLQGLFASEDNLISQLSAILKASATKLTDKDLEKFDNNELSVCSYVKISSKSLPVESKANGRWLRTDKFIYEVETIVDLFIDTYFTPAETMFGVPTKQLSRRLSNFILDLAKELKRYAIPYTRIESAADLNVICNIFERINTTGIKLTTFDLVNAKSFKSEVFKKGLLEFIKTELKIWKKSPAVIYLSKDAPDFGVLLRIFYLADRLMTHTKADGLSNAEILEKPPEYWHKLWISKSLALKNFLEKAASVGMLDWGIRTFTEYVAAIFVAKPELLNDSEYWAFCVKASLALSLTATSFNKSNTNFVTAMYVYGIKRSQQPAHLKHAILAPKAPIANELNDDTILNIRYQHRNVPKRAAALELMYGTAIESRHILDLTGEPVSLKYGSERNTEEHHLVPVNGAKNATGFINSMANLVVISSAKNRSISNQEFFKYLRDIWAPIYNRDKDKFSKILESNFIPEEFALKIICDDTLDINLEKFWEERATLIATYAAKQVGVTYAQHESYIPLEEHDESEDEFEENLDTSE